MVTCYEVNQHVAYELNCRYVVFVVYLYIT